MSTTSISTDDQVRTVTQIYTMPPTATVTMSPPLPSLPAEGMSIPASLYVRLHKHNLHVRLAR